MDPSPPPFPSRARRRPVLRAIGRLAIGGLAGGLAAPLRALGPEPEHHTVAAAEGRFMGWPANHGIWTWDAGREILVGHADGPWRRRRGHNVGHPQRNVLARSLDGGGSWRRERPDPFVGGPQDRDPQIPAAPIRFDHPDLALRVAAGRDGPGQARMGRFFVSTDRGRHWRGPYRFSGLDDEPALTGRLATSRTRYLVTGPESALLFLSARDPALGRHAGRLDKTFVAATDDGGRSFRLVSWVVPWTDRFRAVMPDAVRLAGSGTLLVALRRRDPRGAEEDNWVDLYASRNGGRSWGWRSRVAATGAHNGNPPALLQLRDGRLACAYANRSRREVLLRLSVDGGWRWGPERRVVASPFDHDLGYPQMVENHRGELVIIYYLATAERPQSRIEAALLRP